MVSLIARLEMFKLKIPGTVCFQMDGALYAINDKVTSNKYANDRTGELTFFDPLMTPEALRARGINIRDFRLL